MILLSCLIPGLSLGQVPEGLTGLRISELRGSSERICPEGRAAHGVREIYEHRESSMLLHHTVRHGDERRFVRVIPMGVEELWRSHLRGPVDAHDDLGTDTSLAKSLTGPASLAHSSPR